MGRRLRSVNTLRCPSPPLLVASVEPSWRFCMRRRMMDTARLGWSLSGSQLQALSRRGESRMRRRMRDIVKLGCSSFKSQWQTAFQPDESHIRRRMRRAEMLKYPTSSSQALVCHQFDSSSSSLGGKYPSNEATVACNGTWAEQRRRGHGDDSDRFSVAISLLTATESHVMAHKECKRKR